MINPSAIAGIIKQIENTTRMAPRSITPDILEKFKFFMQGVKNHTVTYEMCNEISTICKSIRKPISDRIKKQNKSTKNRKKSISGNRK